VEFNAESIADLLLDAFFEGNNLSSGRLPPVDDGERVFPRNTNSP